MIIKANNFVPAPEGTHDAVCVDFIDRGNVQGQFGTKHKCRVVFQIDAKMEDGKRFIVGKSFTVSLHEKSILRKFLKSWRGRDFTKEELAGFDTENIVGACCQLVLVQEEKDAEVYCNIAAILKAKVKMTADKDYVRFKDRDPKQQQRHDPATAEEPPTEPF
jgi:hypothetical protein